MKLMFIDESGDHSLDPKKIDKTYPVFVLAGCVFDEDYYNNTFVPNFNSFKKAIFGGDDICLHTLEMSRPEKSKDKRFLLFRDKSFRAKFYEELNKLIKNTDFTLIACAILKSKHITKYGLSALDPYLLSFDNLVNRLIYDLKKNKGKIFAEKRLDNLDQQLEIAWLNIKVSGTDKVKPAEIKDRIEDLQLINKRVNDAGLQLADLLANPIGRHVLKMKYKPAGNEIDFSVIKSKFRNKNGVILKYGLSILP
ncbi:MAG: hypothetical protein COU25_03390 [Candidatus Levybacteria bacterium CG10_big_fil_rev_8_21_14_0_10_35_13]|nr:MAG: hypothetical protein COU25_03390 [Candidatus Levybacteria bacterium CG10_big_fil_rev_8_21_14_0_10_35_13]